MIRVKSGNVSHWKTVQLFYHSLARLSTFLNLSSAGTSKNYAYDTSALQSITQSATIPVILQTKIFVLVVNRTAITCVCVNFTAYDTTGVTSRLYRYAEASTVYSRHG